MKNLKFFLLIISLILFFNIIFFNFSYATLYIVKDQEGNNICITNQESLISKYKLLNYIILIIQGSSTSQKLYESETNETQTISEIKSENSETELNVKIIDSTNYTSKTGNYIYVEGIIKNQGKSTVKNIIIKVQALDKNDKLISINDCIPFPSTLTPGEEATYQVMVNYNAKIASFKTTIYGN